MLPGNISARSLYSKLLEEDLIAHLCVLQNLVPTEHLNVEVNVAHPLKPAQTVRHGREVLLPFQPS